MAAGPLQKSASDLPEGVELFTHQAAGHRHGQGRLGIGVLKHSNGDILKPMFDGDRRASIELSFYQKVFEINHTEPLLQELQCFLPDFHGTWETNIGEKSVQYICLEDICKNFENPSVLDVKMGRITYDDDASEAKILSQSTKFKFGEALGIRILGMKVYSDENKEYLPKIEKSFWRQLAPETITSGLNIYLTPNKHINLLILSGFIHKLEKLSNWFSRQRLFKFIGSSLLFVYEGTYTAWTMWCKANQINIDCNSGKCKEIAIKEDVNIDCNSSSSKEAAKEDVNTGCSRSEYKGISMEGNSVIKENVNIGCCCSDSNEIAMGDNVIYNLCHNNADTADQCDTCSLSKSVCLKLADCPLYRVVMIDFSHCFPFDAEDTNYTFGLHKLINCLKELLNIQKES